MSVTPHADDRVCQHDGCITVLCVHNTGDECYLHTRQRQAKDKHRQARIDRGLVLNELQKLMLQHDQRIAA